MFGMKRTRLHPPALTAIIDAATSPQKFSSRSQIAAAAGMSHASLSNAEHGRQQLSPRLLDAVCEVLGIDPEAIQLPLVALDTDALADALAGRIEELQVDVCNLARDVRQLGD